MSEKEKMLNGEMYYPDKDEVLFNERIQCKTLCHQYNNLSPELAEKRKKIIKNIVGKTKEKY